MAKFAMSRSTRSSPSGKNATKSATRAFCQRVDRARPFARHWSDGWERSLAINIWRPHLRVVQDEKAAADNRSGLLLFPLIAYLLLVVFYRSLRNGQGPGSTRLCAGGGHRHRVDRHAAKAVDARHPIIVERRVDYSMVPRRMIKAVLIGDDPYVRQPAEENQRAKFVLLFPARLGKGRPV